MLNVGDEVMMIEDELHAKCPENYPAKGSIGIVVRYSPHDKIVLVDWGQDSGVDLNDRDEYARWCGEKRLAKVNANTQVNTQKEVCNMSKFKIGDKVVFTNAQKHETISRFYPVVGTVGTVVKIDKHPIAEKSLLVDWGNAEGVDVWEDGTKSWWCGEDDVEPEYTDNEVWEMLKPKMKQFARDVVDIDLYSPTVKNMVVTAYRSGYGRATKGRSFIIKPKVDEKPSEKSIDDVLNGKMIVTFSKDDDNYWVSKFDHAIHSKQGMEIKGMEIHGDVIYNSDGGTWTDGFDIIEDPDCEMYVAIPFSEAVEQFDSDSIKALYCDDKLLVLYHIKQWTIGEYNGMVRFGNKTYASIKFEQDDSESEYYSEIYGSKFKALVPICDYLRVNGVNV